MDLNIKQICPIVKLEECTKNIGDVIRTATEICKEKTIEKSNVQIFNMLYNLGHTSIFEHIVFRFKISNVSRVLSHQLVRYRTGVSFTQKSQRSTQPSTFLLPKSIATNERYREVAVESIGCVYDAYKKLVESGVSEEDARYILPNGTETEIIMTMNGRELITAGKQRLCQEAQQEIRLLFVAIQGIVEKEFKPLGVAMFPNCDGCKKRLNCKRWSG
jgi:thymidylate synthase (FAD)